MPKILLIVIASGALLVGAASMITPIPGGSILIAISLAILICASPRFARAVTFSRAQVPVLNKSMSWLEDRVGRRFGNALRRTRPPLG